MPRRTLLAPSLALSIIATAGLSCGGGTEPGIEPPVASPSTSTLAVSSPTVASGSSVTVTLQAKDEDGVNVPSDDEIVQFALGGSGTSQGTFGAVTGNSSGAYTATFTGTTAGTARQITAMLNGSPVSATTSVTVTPGPFSNAQSTTAASSPTVASGSTVTLTVTLRDQAGNAVTAGGATIAFVKGSGTSDGNVSAVTDNSNGTYTATFTGTTAGTARSIGATVNGLALVSAQPTITVTPGPISTATSVVTVSAANVLVNGSATLTLTGRDAAGNALTTGGATVAFTRGAGTSDGTIGPVTDNNNGTYTATFTATTAGNARSIGATIGGVAVTSTAPTITVASLVVSPAMSTVTVSSGSVQSGTTATITFQAKDANGNDIPAGGATVVFSLGSGTSTGTIGSVTDNGNGTYTATFTGILVGTARSIAATVNSDAVTTTQPTITVTPGAISASTSQIGVSAPSIASGTTATLTLQARDAAGNALTTGGATVAFGLGSGTSAGTIGAVNDNGSGTYTATFTGTTAGTARTITATVNTDPVTATTPTITVVPGAPSTAQSVVTLSSSYVALAEAATITLTTRDAHGNALTSGGASVDFFKFPGTSDGNVGPVVDHGNGTYTATFTGTMVGTERPIGAGINGQEVTTPKPTITVYTKGLTFSTDSLPAVATSGQVGTPRIVAIFANGAQRADGLQASKTYTTPSIAACQNSDWLGPLSFDFPDANPLALVSFTPNATTLGVYTCTADVTISSTTAGYANKTFKVALNVARGLVASTAVNLIAMGDAGNNQVQNILPDARVTITNGGRGIVSNVQATVIDASSNGSPDPWLTNSNLRWEPVVGDPSQRTLPATLIVTTSVAPFAAEATIRVTGNGMPNLDIPVSIFFNVEPEVVANPRGLTFTAFPGGGSQQATVVAYNSNRNAEGFDPGIDSLRAYERTPTPALPSWITSVTFTPLLTAAGMDTASNVAITINPASLLADSVYTDTVRIRAQGCETDTSTNTCTLTGFRFNDYDLPVTVVVERGLVLSAADVAMFAAAGTNTVTRDVSIANGGATPISGLSANLGGAAWLSYEFIGGTTAPATLRLTANPTGFPRGTVLNATVTVSASTPTGVPLKSFPVTFRVY